MNYKKIVEATFIERPNRFISYCKVNENYLKECSGLVLKLENTR